MFHFHFHFLLLSLVYAYTTCPPFWCCTLYRYASGCKRQLYLMSMYVLGLCYMLFRTATCNVIDGFLVVVANSAYKVEIDVLIQNSVLVGSRCQAPPPPPLLLLLLLLYYYGGCCCIFLNILKVMFMLCVWHFQNHSVKNFMLRWRTSWKTMFKVCMR